MNKRFFYAVLLSFLFTSLRQKEQTWLALGDSITYLNDHPAEAENRITKGYMTMVAEKMPYLRFINQGHNGWTSGGIADAIEKLGLTKADMYTVFLGTNDWWQGRALGTILDYKNNTGNGTVNGSFRIIINKLRSLNPAAKIILITPMQRVDFVYLGDMRNNAWGSYKAKNGQMLEQFANAIKAIGKIERIAVVDLYHEEKLAHRHLVKYKRLKDPKAKGAYRNYPYPHFTTIPFNPETDEYPYPPDAVDMTYDGLHPSDKGYALIAEKLVKAMKAK
jgi:lysophospholipase L1-like esterase